MTLKVHYIAVCLAIFLPISLAAQGLPVLAPSPDITHGVLPNGIDYYMVQNRAVSGVADFAVMQKGQTDREEVRRLLATRSSYSGRTFSEYFSGKGCGYGDGGFVSWFPEAAAMRFANLSVINPIVVDSTLLVLCELMEKYPGEQTVFISGDINTAQLTDRLKMFSLSVLKRRPSSIKPEYKWEPREGTGFSLSSNDGREAVVITVKTRMPMPERSELTSSIPLITRKLVSEYSRVLENRLRHVFSTRFIPLADVRCKYVPTRESLGDESFSVSIAVNAKDTERSVKALSEVLSSLSRRGCSMEELSNARMCMSSSASKTISGKPVTNSEYLDICMKSCLYGTDMAPSSTVNSFLSRMDLEIEKEYVIFKRFCPALFNMEKNMTVDFCVPGGAAELDRLKSAFVDSWNADSSLDYAPQDFSEAAKRISLPRRKKKIQKITSVADAVTGGQMWIYSNGLKVVYRNIPGSGKFSYSLMMRGGADNIPGLKKGERAFVDDMPRLFDVAGMSSEDFRMMLSSFGIEMDVNISLSNISIQGSAPSSGLPMVLKSLWCMGYRRSVNRLALETYRDAEKVRIELEQLSGQGLTDDMDARMAPDYFYTKVKDISRLDDELPSKVSRYMDKQFSKCADGVLILIGDLNQNTVEGLVQDVIGVFAPGKNYASRFRASYPLEKYWDTEIRQAYMGVGGKAGPSVNVGVTAVLPFNISNFMALNVAALAVKSELDKQMFEEGMTVSVTPRFENEPQGYASLFISCKPCDPDGLPEGIEPRDSYYTLSKIRKVVSRLACIDLDPAVIEMSKMTFSKHMDSRVSDSDFLMKFSLYRHSEGKDMLSGYAGRINSVSVADVRRVLSALESGSKEEIVIK